MFPVHVTEVLQQLSYLALIFMFPMQVWGTWTLIELRMGLKNHIDNDHTKHIVIDHHLGKHDSQIHDLEMDNAARSGKLNL